MKYNTLPGIVDIHVVKCEYIPAHAMLRSIAGATVVLAVPTSRIKFYGTPSLKWNGEVVNGARQETATLEFSTRNMLPEYARLAFVVTVASGKKYLVGTREPNYPVIAYSETVGAPDGSAALRSYKITLKAMKAVLPCLI